MLYILIHLSLKFVSNDLIDNIAARGQSESMFPMTSYAKCRHWGFHHAVPSIQIYTSLQWLHYGRDGVSNHQPHDCLLNRLFGRRSKKKSKLRVTGLCAGNSPGTGEFPTQMASNTLKCFHLMTSSWLSPEQRWKAIHSLWSVYHQKFPTRLFYISG